MVGLVWRRIRKRMGKGESLSLLSQLPLASQRMVEMGRDDVCSLLLLRPVLVGLVVR